MLTITPRLGSLDAKARLATRTAKDGEEYSQLIFEVTDQEVNDTEINGLFSTPHAYAAFKALHRAVKGIREIETDFKIEGAAVFVRLGAVSAKNGAQFQFANCVVDKIRIGSLDSDAMKFGFRVTAKPALNAAFGELVSRFGHTAMIGLNAESPTAQADLPLPPPAAEKVTKIYADQTLADAIAADRKCTHGKTMDDNCEACNAEADHSEKSPIGSPKDERAKAKNREQLIAEEIVRDRGGAMDAAIGDGKSTAELLASKPKKKRAARHATH
jgi:hypothetical protein